MQQFFQHETIGHNCSEQGSLAAKIPAINPQLRESSLTGFRRFFSDEKVKWQTLALAGLLLPNKGHRQIFTKSFCVLPAFNNLCQPI
jgi:hypothetical protein